MKIQGLNHVSVLVRNLEQARHFFVDILGFQQHEREQWFIGGSGLVHAVEISSAPLETLQPYDVVRHAAFQVDDLNEVLARLLKASLEPFQLDFQINKKVVTDPNDDLSYGTGTVFVYDADENLFEFVQVGRGILFAKEPDLLQRK